MSQPTITVRDRADAYGIGLRIAEQLEKQYGSRYGGATAHEVASVAGKFIAEIRAADRILAEREADELLDACELVTAAVADIQRDDPRVSVHEASFQFTVEIRRIGDDILGASVDGVELPQQTIDARRSEFLAEVRAQDRYADESDRTEAAIDAAIERKEVA